MSESSIRIPDASTQTEEKLRIYFAKKFPHWEKGMVAIAAARSYGKLDGFLSGYTHAYFSCTEKCPPSEKLKEALEYASLYRFAVITWPENPLREWK